VDAIINHLSTSNEVEVVDRDLAINPPPFIDGNWLGAAFAKEAAPEHEESLKVSNTLIDEVLDADVLVIGAPMYNFSIPAALKAYFDQIARAGRTFKYTESGPVGLVEGKKAYVVIATGGVALGSPYDFSKGYLQTFLGFIGVTDVEFVTLDEMMSKSAEKITAVEEAISAI
jgi:FMN-dependent NADH-azoreductase